MQKLLLATFNRGKIEDYKAFFNDLPLELIELKDIGITQDFEEKYETFEENARGKAEFYAKLSNLPTLSDDSGIEIPFYNMEPGVQTKRWNGKDNSEDQYQQFILGKIKAIPRNQRHAQLRAVLALSIQGKVHLAEGIIKGLLAENPYTKSVTHGYPWDRVFIIPELRKYYEELTDEENYQYNHRRIALEKLKPIIVQHIGL